MRRLSLLLVFVLLVGVLHGCKESPRYESISDETVVEEQETQTTLPPMIEETEKVTEPTENVTEPPASDAQIEAGSVEGMVYTNNYFDLSYTIDFGWSFDSEESLMEHNGLSQNLSETDVAQELSTYNATLMVMNASNGIESINIYLAEKPFPITDAKELLTAASYSVESHFADNSEMSLESTDIIEVDFCGEQLYALKYVVNYTQYNISAHILQFVVFEQDYMMSITITAMSDMNINNMLGNFSKTGEQAATSDTMEQGAEVTDQNIYTVSAIPGTLSIGAEYHVYSLDNEYTSDMCKAQGTDKSRMETYLALCGNDMIILPKDAQMSKPEFEINVRVKAEKDYGVDNLKDLDENAFKLLADTLIAGFSTSDAPVTYTVYENDTAKYIVFDWTLLAPQRRYATVINGKMIYFFAEAGGEPISQEQDEQLRKIIDSLQY